METETKKDDKLEKVVTTIQSKFQTFQNEAKQLATQCLTVKVTDVTTLDLARKIVNNANDLNKRIEAKRVELKGPYITIGKEIDRISKLASGDIDKAITHIKNEFDIWNKAQAELARKEKAELEKKKETLDKYDAQLKVKSNACKNASDCQTLIASIVDKFPAPELFGPYAEESIRIKQGYIDYLNGKIATFSGASKVEALEAKADIATTNEIIQAKAEVLSNSIIPEKSKTRKTVMFKVIDEKLVDRTFLSVDESKIKQYASVNKEVLSETPFKFGGVEFWIEEKPVLG